MINFGYVWLLIIGIMGWSFFILVVVVAVDFRDDVEFLIKQIPCEELRELSIFLKTHVSKNYVMEECF